MLPPKNWNGYNTDPSTIFVEQWPCQWTSKEHEEQLKRAYPCNLGWSLVRQLMTYIVRLIQAFAG